MPDDFDGLPVRFHQTFMGLVTPEMAGTDDPVVVAMLNLAMWGAPTSPPMHDPRNTNIVYQRFQRAIMAYDAACDCVQSPLLASYLKDILVGNPLPPDLQAESAGNLLTQQYLPGVPLAILEPDKRVWLGLLRPRAPNETDLDYPPETFSQRSPSSAFLTRSPRARAGFSATAAMSSPADRPAVHVSICLQMRTTGSTFGPRAASSSQNL